MAKAAKKEPAPVLVEKDEGKALIPIESLNPAEVFAPGGTAKFVKQAEDLVREFQNSPLNTIKTEEGRKAIFHFDRRIAASKTGFETMRKEYTAKARQAIEDINAEGKKAFERFIELQEEVTAELDKYKAEEKAKVEAMNEMLGDLQECSILPIKVSSQEVRDRLTKLQALLSGNEWGSYIDAAREAADQVRTALEARLDAVVEQEEKDAELEKLRQESADRAKKDEEERLRKEGEERAKREAEEKVQKDKEAADAKVKEESERAARAEQDAKNAKAREEQAKKDLEESQRKAAADKAESDRKAEEARIKAEQDAQAAADKARQDEIDRQAEAQRLKDEEQRKRDEDKAHRAKVNNAALKAIMKSGASEEIGIKILSSIVRGEVPNITIKY